MKDIKYIIKRIVESKNASLTKDDAILLLTKYGELYDLKQYTKENINILINDAFFIHQIDWQFIATQLAIKLNITILDIIDYANHQFITKCYIK